MSVSVSNTLALPGWCSVRDSSFSKKNSSRPFEELSLIWEIHKYFLFAWLKSLLQNWAVLGTAERVSQLFRHMQSPLSHCLKNKQHLLFDQSYKLLVPSPFRHTYDTEEGLVLCVCVVKMVVIIHYHWNSFILHVRYSNRVLLAGIRTAAIS